MPSEQVLQVGRELRPSRIAWLVDPFDVPSVREAISWATSCWGGEYWPLIPVFGRRPSWFRVDGRGSLGRDDIVAGYLETYSPDWVVNLVDGFEAPVPTDRLVVPRRGELRAPTTGAAADSLEPVLEDLFERRLRFHEHQPPDVVAHASEDENLLGAVMLGLLAMDGARGRVRGLFCDRLGGSERSLTTDLLLRAQLPVAGRPDLITPLSVGSEDFMFRRRSKDWLYVYFCSASRAFDAIELWNLRAAGLSVFAFPLTWADKLAGALDQLARTGEVLPVAARRLTEREHRSAREIVAAHHLPLVEPPVFWGRRPAARSSTMATSRSA